MHYYSGASGSPDTMFKSIMGIVILIFVGLAIGGRGCQVDDAQAHRALKAAGYSDVRITDRSNWFVSWGGCSDSDAVQWDAVAKNARGESVNVIVCAGWPFKGATVRVK
jgi:hypothetical protein